MKRDNGFTIIELAIVILVLAIIIGIALPNSMAALRINQLNGFAQQIQRDLELAKLTAVSQASHAVVDFNVADSPNVILAATGAETSSSTPGRIYELGVGTPQPIYRFSRALPGHVNYLDDPGWGAGNDPRYVFFDPEGSAHFPDPNNNGIYTLGITSGILQRHIQVFQDGTVRVFETSVSGLWDGNW